MNCPPSTSVVESFSRTAPRPVNSNWVSKFAAHSGREDRNVRERPPHIQLSRLESPDQTGYLLDQRARDQRQRKDN